MNKERYKIYGAADEIRERILKSQEDLDRGEKIENEIEKSEKDLRTINIFKNKIKEYFENEGMKESDLPDVSQIHFLRKEDLVNYLIREGEKKEDAENAEAYFTTETHQILINYDLAPEERDPHLLHDMVHFSSFRAVNALKEGEGITTERRIGYQIAHSEKENKDKEYLFRYFTEAVTEYIAHCILDKLIDKYKEIHNEIRPGRIKEGFDQVGYYPEVVLVHSLRKKLEAEGQKDIWKNIQKGLISGEMMYLRKIEGVLGKGSLRLLADLDGTNIKTLEAAEKLGLKKAVARIEDFIKRKEELFRLRGPTPK